jgi:hypothetical protein
MCWLHVARGGCCKPAAGEATQQIGAAEGTLHLSISDTWQLALPGTARLAW